MDMISERNRIAQLKYHQSAKGKKHIKEYQLKNKEKYKEYYLKNKEKITEYKKLYVLRDKEKWKKYQKEYQLKNKKRVSKQRKGYYLKNKEKIRSYAKRFYLKNKEKILKDAKEYYLKNKEKIKKCKKKFQLKNAKMLAEKAKQRRIKDKEKISKQRRKRYLKNVEKFKKQVRKSYLKHRKKIIAHGVAYTREKRRRDPYFRLIMNLRSRIRHALKGEDKSARSRELIGCTIEELWKQLEKNFKPGMTRENYGHYTWHVDHIIPCFSFDLSDPEQQKKCFHYTNLQPLWAFDNLSKGKKIISGDITSPKT
jgi:hypothetical protein